MGSPAVVSSSLRDPDLSRSIRVEDYLNDKLQTSTDLSTIDNLIRDVRKQQELLEQQVKIALLSDC